MNTKKINAPWGQFTQKRLRPLFYDADGAPRWNKLYTREAIAQGAGYQIPEDKSERRYFFGTLTIAIGRVRKADKLFIAVKTRDEKFIYTNNVKAFVSVRAGKRQLYGFTTDLHLHLQVLRSSVIQMNAGLHQGEQLADMMERDALLPENQIEAFRDIFEDTKVIGRELFAFYKRLFLRLKAGGN